MRFILMMVLTIFGSILSSCRPSAADSHSPPPLATFLQSGDLSPEQVIPPPGQFTPIYGTSSTTHVDPAIIDLLFFNGERTDISKQKGATRLMEAAQEGVASEVRKIIAEKANVNAATETGITALMLAARFGNLEIVEMLVSAGASINCSTDSPGAVLPSLRSTGYAPWMQEFVFLPFQTDLKQYKDNKSGFTPLVLASLHGHTSVVQFLVSRGADVNRKGYGASPLATAIKFNHADIAIYLINQGADTKPSEPISKSIRAEADPLYQSLDSKDLELAELLIDKEHRDLNSTSNSQYIIPILHFFAEIGSAPAIELLVRKGAKINMIDWLGLTPLLHAVSLGQQDAVASLLNLGADINAAIAPPDQKARAYADYAGATPLSLAIQKQYFDIANLLIDKGPELNVKDKYGRSAIIYAIHLGKTDMVALLLSKGADIHTQDNNGNGVIIAALPKLMGFPQSENSRMFDLLIENGADVNMANNRGETPLIMVINNKEVKNVQSLLRLGADPLRPDKGGLSPLQHTVRASCFECAGILVEHGADVNEKNSKDGSILIQAIHMGRLNFAEFFISKGADVNAKNNNGQTALLLAAQAGHFETVKMLIENKADVNANDKYGQTALLLAAQAGHFETVKMLIEKGANINAVSKSGSNAFVIASISGNKEVSQYLEAKGADKRAWLKHANEIEKMKRQGFIPKDASTEQLTPQALALFKREMQEIGIQNPDSWTPDSRLSSPESTWKLYIQALMQWDLGLAAKCVVEKQDIGMYIEFGREKTKKIVSEMMMIEKINIDDKNAKYRMPRENINGEDITYDINFVKLFGEWRIERF